MTPARKFSLASIPLLFCPVVFGQPFSGVSIAKVSMVNGTPQLLVNGAPTPPLVFFFNNEVANPAPSVFATQVAAAAKNGVHIYSFLAHWNWLGADANAKLDWSATDREFQRFIDLDPQAMFLVRIRSEPPGNWSGFAAAPAGDAVRFQDGRTETSAYLSWGSQYFHDNSAANVRNFVKHYEADPIGKRILVYHVGGGSSNEWFGYGGFQRDYRFAGPDYSDANAQAFRKWLTQRYGADAALQRAWARDTTTLATAAIPRDPGRFPVSDRQPIVAFYTRPAQQDWIDFSAYESDNVSQWILDLARVVKLEAPNKLTAFFYGYTYEAYAPSLMGHSRLDRLLTSPDVDIICSPVSYQQSRGSVYPDRWLGGPAGFMSAVDSVAAHGKLWMVENDILAFPVPDTSFESGSRILQRDLAAALVHRAGTWWMDLFATGPYADPRYWPLMATSGLRNYRAVYANPTPYQPDIAVISDAVAHLYVSNDNRIPENTLMLFKNYALKAGAAVGFYTLDDFIAGIGPQCPVYIFANENYLDDAQIAGIGARLDREGALAIWQYAPGFMGPSSSGADRTSKATGVTVIQSDGYTGSNGAGPMAGQQWGFRFGSTVSPRLVVQDPQAVTVGHYQDGTISTAVKRTGSHISLFSGDFILSSDFLRAVVPPAGVHLWTTDDSIVHTDGNLLAIHSGVAGTKKIMLPADVTAQPIDGLRATQNGTALSADFALGDTRWFQLNSPPALASKIATGGIVNGASYMSGGVAPGEVVTIFGSDLGPSTLVGLTLDWSGRVAYQTGGTKVTFDDVPAPMIYAQRGQISVVTPYVVGGKQTSRVRVYAGHSWSAPVDVPVVASAPGIFTLASGSGQAAALNADTSYNTGATPAAKGSVVVLYVTGEGATTPAGTDGLPANSVFPKPQQAVQVTIGNKNAAVLYAGAAPGFVAGLMQVNVAVPADVASGDVPVVLSVGGVPSQSNVTIAVR